MNYARLLRLTKDLWLRSLIVIAFKTIVFPFLFQKYSMLAILAFRETKIFHAHF